MVVYTIFVCPTRRYGAFDAQFSANTAPDVGERTRPNPILPAATCYLDP